MSKGLRLAILLFGAFLALLGGLLQITRRDSSTSQWIAFSGLRAGNRDIFLTTLSGTPLIRLTDRRGADFQPVWSQDGEWLYYNSSAGINRMRANGRQKMIIAKNPAAYFELGEAPDGNSWVLAALIGGPTRDIYRMNPDGGDLRRLVRGDELSFLANPQWLPEGDRLLFEFNGGVYSMNREGGARRLVVGQPGSVSGAALSPDGRWIVFSSDRGGARNLYLMSREGGEIEALTALPSAWGAVWSPDGTRLVFLAHENQNTDLYLLELEKRRLRRLTTSPGNETGAVWSADGHWLVFAVREGSVFTLFKMRADGSARGVLVEGLAHSAEPAFSPPLKSDVWGWLWVVGVGLIGVALLLRRNFSHCLLISMYTVLTYNNAL